MSQAFRGIGDYPRPGWLEDLSYLLERGVKVTMMYGDRDFACKYLILLPAPMVLYPEVCHRSLMDI